MVSNRKFFKGMLFLILAQVMVGANIVTSKYLLISMPILVLLTIRFSFAAVALLPLHWLTSAKEQSLRFHFCQLGFKDWIFLFFQAISAGFLFNLFMLYGLDYTDANVAGIITAALPAIIALMSWLILRETITRRKTLSVFFATGGLTIVAIGKFHGGNVTHHALKGDVAVFLSLLPEASYYILSQLYFTRLPIFLTSALLNAINAVFFVILLLFHPATFLQLDILCWSLVIALGLSSGFFYVFWNIGSRYVDGLMVSLSTAVMPVATVIFAWLFLGEKLSVVQFLGMSMIIFSIILYAQR